MNTNAAISNESTMITTPWRMFTEGGHKYRIRATYGWRKIGNQDAYWSVTGDIERQAKNNRWCEDSCGCLHGEVAKHFPKLAPSIKWHLCNLTSGPMHYVANAVYWLEKDAGISQYPDKDDPGKAYKNFESHAVIGAFPGDSHPITRFARDLENVGAERARLHSVVESWCLARLPALLAAMKQETDAALSLTISGS